jgi:hypothetical protein
MRIISGDFDVSSATLVLREREAAELLEALRALLDRHSARAGLPAAGDEERLTDYQSMTELRVVIGE